MKVFKVLQKILIVVAVAAFLASLLLCVFSPESDAAFLALLLSNVAVFILATVGAFLLTSKNDTAKRVGHGLMLPSFVVGLTAAALTINENSTANIVMIVAVAALALYYLCTLILFIIKRSEPEATDDPNDDIRVIRIREWKHIMEEGIISQEEYEEKRQQILDIKAKDAAGAKNAKADAEPKK